MRPGCERRPLGLPLAVAAAAWLQRLRGITLGAPTARDAPARPRTPRPLRQRPHRRVAHRLAQLAHPLRPQMAGESADGGDGDSPTSPSSAAETAPTRTSRTQREQASTHAALRSSLSAARHHPARAPPPTCLTSLHVSLCSFRRLSRSAPCCARAQTPAITGRVTDKVRSVLADVPPDQRERVLQSAFDELTTAATERSRVSKAAEKARRV